MSGAVTDAVVDHRDVALGAWCRRSRAVVGALLRCRSRYAPSDGRPAWVRGRIAAGDQLIARRPGNHGLWGRADGDRHRVRLPAGIPGAARGDRPALRGRGDRRPPRSAARDRTNRPGRRAADRPPRPPELDPYQPKQVTAEVPPNPASLRSQVQASLSTLLSVLSLAGLGIGFLSIAAVTIMSVAQRRSEIGLRRAVGYRRFEIARLIVLEAAGVGMLGGILGTSIGVLATAAIASGNHWAPGDEHHAGDRRPLPRCRGRRTRRLLSGGTCRQDHAHGGAALLTRACRPWTIRRGWACRGRCPTAGETGR